MPTPAISPSSATPRKEVGRKQKKPASSETAASVSEQPMPRVAASSARSQIAVSVTLLAIARRELDAEIDAKTDEQRGEGDRDQVEAADQQDAERPT